MDKITPENLEKLLSKLPKKDVPVDDAKFHAWLKVQNHIRDTRKSLQNSPSLWFGFRSAKIAITTLSVLLAVSLVGGVASASKTSLPGETLYTVKKATEAVEKTFATSNEDKVRVYTKLTKTRLGEVETLVEEKRASKDVVKKTLADLQETTQYLNDVITIALTEKPELADETIEISEEEQSLLAEIEQEIEDEDVKEAVRQAISTSKKSAEFLKTVTGVDVRGAQTENEEEENDTATTTSKTIKSDSGEESQASADEKPDETLKSDIQLDTVIESDDEDHSEEDDKNPEILPEPN